MSSNRYIQRMTGAALALLIAGGVYGAPPTPAGLIAFAPMQLKDDSGAQLEHAVVNYRDGTYGAIFTGLGVGGAKGTEVTVSGEVYGLNNVADLEGPFVSELADAPPQEVSSGDLWLYSERGVSILLHTDNSAATIATGSDTVTVRFGEAD